MTEVANTVQDQPQVQEQQLIEPNISQQLAQSLWSNNQTPATETNVLPGAAPQPDQPQTVVADVQKVDEEVIGLDDYFKREFGLDSVAAKAEWESLRKLKEAPPAIAAQEPEYANEESKRIHQLIKAGKVDEVHAFLDQQKKIDRLAAYDITNVNQAAEIIKTNLAFKHPELTQQQIERLYARQYTFPEQPRQGVESDEEYEAAVDSWKKQVQEKEQDMIIDATLAKPELLKQKSQIVLPDIPGLIKPEIQGVNQEDLAAQEAFRNDFIKKLSTEYQKFNGFNVTAIDGDVQLPVSYLVSDDEKLAFNGTVQKAVDNINDFLDNDLGWWNKESNSFNINRMQEDLYLLKNKERILQKVANEAAAQRFLHHQKIQNNVKLNGVNQEIAPSHVPVKSESQELQEAIWKIK